MLDIVINKFVNEIEAWYKDYNLDFTVMYNSDLEMISQYTKSLSTRALFGNSDMSLLTEEDLIVANKESHILMMYNYTPLRKSEERLNNINFEAVFDPKNSRGLVEMDKLKKIGEDDMSRFFQKVRDLDEAHSKPTDFIIRDMIYGEIELTFKLLTTSSRIINDLQFLYLNKLMRNRVIEMSFNMGQDIGQVEFDYTTTFRQVDSVGHIDYAQYGNLQELTFTAKLEGPFFSSYSKTFPMLDTVDIQLKFLDR